MKLLFVADPLEVFKSYKDSTFAMMREAARRGHELRACEPKDVMWQRDGRVSAPLRAFTLTGDKYAWFKQDGEASVTALADVDAVIMRKDPPFDSEYFYATHLLEQAEREGARIYNSPRALRDHDGVQLQTVAEGNERRIVLAALGPLWLEPQGDRAGGHTGQICDRHLRVGRLDAHRRGDLCSVGDQLRVGGERRLRKAGRSGRQFQEGGAWVPARRGVSVGDEPQFAQLDNASASEPLAGGHFLRDEQRSRLESFRESENLGRGGAWIDRHDRHTGRAARQEESHDRRMIAGG